MEEPMTRRKVGNCKKVNEDTKDEENIHDNEGCSS